MTSDTIGTRRHGRLDKNERFLDLIGDILGAKLEYEIGGQPTTAARTLRTLAADVQFLAADIEAEEAAKAARKAAR